MAPQPKLIVVAAFDIDDEGNLLPAFDPIQFDSEDRAKRHARSIAGAHAGVIAWARTADPDIGEYGPPETLFSQGHLPEME